MKKILSTVLALTLFVGLYGCDGSSDRLPEDEFSKSTISSQKKTESKKTTTITPSQAISLAKDHIESQLENKKVIGGHAKASSYRTVLFGDISCEYDATSGAYKINCKGTCWGKDSYGRTLDKYKFDVKVTVRDKYSVSTPYIYLTEA